MTKLVAAAFRGRAAKDLTLLEFGHLCLETLSVTYSVESRMIRAWFPYTYGACTSPATAAEPENADGSGHFVPISEIVLHLVE